MGLGKPTLFTSCLVRRQRDAGNVVPEQEPNYFYPSAEPIQPSERDSRRGTLPVAVIGRRSAKATMRGYSCAANFVFTTS
jgi:hypothetical protein